MCVWPTFLTGMMPRVDVAHRLVVEVGGLPVVRDHRHLDLLQVGEVADLDVEVPRDDVARGVGGHDVDVFDDSEVGAVDGQRAGEVVAHDHVARQVPPLVERPPQVALLILRPGMLGAQRQFAVDVHLVPADLVDPDHRPFRLEIVELLPEPGFLLVDGQRGDLGHLGGQAAQDVLVLGSQVDFLGDGQGSSVARVVEHG